MQQARWCPANFPTIKLNEIKVLAKKMPVAECSKQMEEQISRHSVGIVPGLFKDELGA